MKAGSSFTQVKCVMNLTIRYMSDPGKAGITTLETPFFSRTAINGNSVKAAEKRSAGRGDPAAGISYRLSYENA